MNDTNTPPTGPPQPGGPYVPVAPAPMLESEARTWAMLAHIIAAVASVMSAGTIAFVAPLIIWLLYKDRSALVAFHGKQNLNLQITTLVFGAGAVVLGLVLFIVGLAITLPLWGLYVLYAFIISIVAGVKAYNGEYFRIPLSINFIK
ncbi:DUF4870 domain-containing protein [Demequina lutea]|uniref:DUF4870 domain-containing protein n=1 Tax=Demequina lutea TaxID=431489 RepID=A0A7Y9Z943_9MICO|nr:DUF4870 domain-containing protein [Demequina lutea]NYI41059.1 hypothetical protein [Demequina lutea]